MQTHMEETFLLALEKVRRRFQMRVYGYVIMPEHVHLLVSEPAGDLLPRAIQLLKTKVSIQARKAQQRSAGETAFGNPAILITTYEITQDL
jgi:REP element-mobilizing transposase RayT